MSEQSTNEGHGNNVWIAGQTNKNRWWSCVLE
jgi:hypothetical protein